MDADALIAMEKAVDAAKRYGQWGDPDLLSLFEDADGRKEWRV